MHHDVLAHIEHLHRIREALAIAGCGPVVVTGAPGSGRTALLHRLSDELARDGHRVMAVDPATDPAAVSAFLAGDASGPGPVPPVLVLDDAHRAGHTLVRRLRAAHVHEGAAVVASRPDDVPEGPLDCLRYLPGAVCVNLPPLRAAEIGRVLHYLADAPVPAGLAPALRAATGGNVALLAEFLRSGVAVEVSPTPGRRAGTLGDGARIGLASALDAAWRALALEQVDLLSGLALQVDPTATAAAVRAFLLLLRGEAAQGVALLDAVGGAALPGEAGTPHWVVLVRAMLVGLGLRDAEAGARLLEQAAAARPEAAARFLAERAWLLSVTGSMDAAAQAVREAPASPQPHAQVFLSAARAALALGEGRPAQALPHMRRALIGAPGLREEHPWMEALLTAYMIDCSLLAGRLTEATSLAAGFHAAASGCNWDVAVLLAAVMSDPLSLGRETAAVRPTASVAAE